jgi:hypothetical protein
MQLIQSQWMKYANTRPYADPEAAARKLLEIANATEAVQAGRIHNEKINGPIQARSQSGRIQCRPGACDWTRLAVETRIRNLCEVVALIISAFSFAVVLLRAAMRRFERLPVIQRLDEALKIVARGADTKDRVATWTTNWPVVNHWRPEAGVSWSVAERRATRITEPWSEGRVLKRPLPLLARTGPAGPIYWCPFLGVTRKWLADH